MWAPERIWNSDVGELPYVKQQPFFEIRPVLGQDVIVDIQLFPFHPRVLLAASDAERDVAQLSRSCWRVLSCCLIRRAAKSQLVNASHREITPTMGNLLELRRFSRR